MFSLLLLALGVVSGLSHSFPPFRLLRAALYIPDRFRPHIQRLLSLASWAVCVFIGIVFIIYSILTITPAPEALQWLIPVQLLDPLSMVAGLGDRGVTAALRIGDAAVDAALLQLHQWR